ncbi:MAG: DUF1206 domain-containing protein [Gemmatimonadota bacterium]|nr:DUF1206 domain-containing protein [Gemmatimonadota bacterium]
MSSPIEVADVAPWVERLARVGYAAKGVLYITVGLLAAQAGLGPGGETTDTHGALRVVLGLTFGHILLFVAAAGLMGYALWRLVEAVVDPDGRGTGLKGLALRTGSAARGVFHGGLAIAAIRLASGSRSGDGSDPRQWTAFTFGLPGGELLVLLAAAGITGYGGYQLFRAYTAKLGRQLDLSPLPARAAGLVVGVSRFGIAARGIVFGLIGFFLLRAAVDHDAGEAGGLEKSLDTLAGIGRWPFVAVASGLVAYGLYELVNARYRRIRVE